MRWLMIVAMVLAARTAGAQGLELTRPIVSVGFASGSARVADGVEDGLQAAVRWQKNHPMRLLVIQGYADHVGAARANLTLSQDRSDAVRAELLALGADPLRIIEASYGEGDRAGRRVDVRGTLIDLPDLVMGQQPVPSSRGVRRVPPARPADAAPNS